MAPPEETTKSREYIMRKYLLLLATLVATVTYSVGFNPPGGVWQDTDAGHLAGDPINRDTHHLRYLVFFYCNATAFASSLVVVVLVLLLAVRHESKGEENMLPLCSLRVVMVLDLLSLMGAYGAGTCWDTLTVIYSLLLAAAIFVVPMVLALLLGEKNEENNRDRELKKNDWPRKVLMLLATFTTSITYVAGLNTPGGFWDSTQDGHHAGDAVLQEHHACRHMVFFICNTTAFGASLLIIVLLLNSKLRHHITPPYYKFYGCIVIVALIGLVGAYAAGSSRETDTTIYVGALVGAVLVCILFQVAIIKCFKETEEQTSPSSATQNNGGQKASQLDEARSLVLLLATLAATVTYQAGLDPPGGCWLDDGDGHKAGDPVLLTTNPRRYKVFFFCNSTAFVASLVAIILVQKIYVLQAHTLEAAMILDLFGLIGAYAAGSCRDVSTSIYVMALAGIVLVYVVIHIVFGTLDDKDSSKSPGEKLMEKRRKRLLLFAILGATITYQAGLTPPSGFWPEDDHSGHRAGDPILFYNYPRRYNAFFYCNSVSFMSSIALIILLVNPNLYRPAIRSYALSVCTVAGMSALMGAFAAGSSQHMRTSIYVFVLVAVVLAFVIPLFIIVRKPGEQPPEEQGGDRETGDQPQNEQGGDGNTGGHPPVEQGGATITGEQPPEKQGGDGDPERKQYTKRKYLMVLGILAASVTYQAGLDPPGGVWQANSHGHATGDPILHDKRRHRYRTFFYCNSTSFVASIVVIVLLLLEKLQEKLREKLQEDTISKEEPQEDSNSKNNPQEDQWLLKAMNTTIVLDMLGLLGAYEAGSSRGEGETFWYVIALIITVLGYLAIYVVMSLFNNKPKKEVKEPNETPSAHPMLTPGPLQV